jgi:hypothetical protein
MYVAVGTTSEGFRGAICASDFCIDGRPVLEFTEE